jgi:hypothetical protein
MSSGVTIQGVFYRTQTGYAGGRAFFTKNDWDTSNGYYYAMTGNDSPATYEQGFNQQGNSSIKLSGQLMAQNAWYFVTVKGSYPGANGYVQFWTNSTITASSSVGTLTLGGNAKSPTICRLDDDCKGYYDEVRISNIARSDSWINADYYGWTNSLLSFGSEESQAVAGAIKNLYLPIIVE